MYFPILSADFVAVGCNLLILSLLSVRFGRTRARRRLALFRIQMMSEKYKRVEIDQKKNKRRQRWWKMSKLIFEQPRTKEQHRKFACVKASEFFWWTFRRWPKSLNYDCNTVFGIGFSCICFHSLHHLVLWILLDCTIWLIEFIRAVCAVSFGIWIFNIFFVIFFFVCLHFSSS